MITRGNCRGLVSPAASMVRGVATAAFLEAAACEHTLPDGFRRGGSSSSFVDLAAPHSAARNVPATEVPGSLGQLMQHARQAMDNVHGMLEERKKFAAASERIVRQHPELADVAALAAKERFGSHNATKGWPQEATLTEASVSPVVTLLLTQPTESGDFPRLRVASTEYRQAKLEHWSSFLI